MSYHSPQPCMRNSVKNAKGSQNPNLSTATWGRGRSCFVSDAFIHLEGLGMSPRQHSLCEVPSLGVPITGRIMLDEDIGCSVPLGTSIHTFWAYWYDISSPETKKVKKSTPLNSLGDHHQALQECIMPLTGLLRRVAEPEKTLALWSWKDLGTAKITTYPLYARNIRRYSSKSGMAD